MPPPYISFKSLAMAYATALTITVTTIFANAITTVTNTNTNTTTTTATAIITRDHNQTTTAIKTVAAQGCLERGSTCGGGGRSTPLYSFVRF